MRIASIILAFFITGCVTPPVTAPPAGLTDAQFVAPPGAVQAIFPIYPADLFNAAADVCSKPGQTAITDGPDMVRCESLPDVEAAAAIVLQYDGTLEALPVFVSTFVGRQVSEGYLVTADNFIRVPQRSGAIKIVRMTDLLVNGALRQLLRSAGGRPL